MGGITVNCTTGSSLPLGSPLLPKETCPFLALVLAHATLAIWKSLSFLFCQNALILYSASSAVSPWPSPCWLNCHSQCLPYISHHITQVTNTHLPVVRGKSLFLPAYILVGGEKQSKQVFSTHKTYSTFYSTSSSVCLFHVS